MQDSKQSPLTILKNFHPFFQSILQDVIFQSVVKSFPELSSFAKESIKIEHPLQENYGDYSTNIAMTLVKDLHISPKEISQQLVNVINDVIKEHLSISLKPYSKDDDNKSFLLEDILENISIAGSGFINITIKPHFLITYIDSLLGDKRVDLTTSVLKGSKIIVEFANQNLFKEFHIGHLRNIVLGENYSRMYQSIGAEVRRANYQGDVGLHVAKTLWGIGEFIKEKKDPKENISVKEKASFLGNAYALGSQKYESIESVKKEIIEINKMLYRQDGPIVNLWKKYRPWSLAYYDEVYERLGTKFDRFYFESEVAQKGMELVEKHISDRVFQKSEGAIIFQGEKFGLHTRVFVSKEGYATYEAKDMALPPLKYSEYPYDLSLILTADEQTPYFAVMIKALSQFNPKLASKTRHVPFGMVNLKEGKLSSRSGNVITADWLLNEAKEKIKEIMKSNQIKNAEWASSLADRQVHKKEKLSAISAKDIETISEKLAIAAVKYSMLKVGTSSDIAFNIDESISLEGDSGPYIMYTFARCKSVFRKLEGIVKGKNSVPNIDIKKYKNKEILLSTEELEVLRTLYRFPEIVLEATRNFSPNVLCTYLFDLAQKYNGFYHKHTILGEEETKEFRLWLTYTTSEIIQKGLYLLGIETVERM